MQRIVETARCCGKVHKRWRKKGTHTGFVRQTFKPCCPVCGVRLNYQHRPVTKESYRVRYHRAAGLATMHGLSRHGEARKRILLTEAERKKRARQRWRKRSKVLRAAGLTTRGTQPRQRVWTELEGMTGKARDRARDVLRYRETRPHLMPSVAEKAWNALRSPMNVTVPELLPTLERSDDNSWAA